MNIQTQFINPPVPKRDFDWCAVDAEKFDDEGGPIGYGRTEQEAIAVLMGKLGATCEAVAEELVGRGFTDSEVAEIMEGELV